MPAMLAAQEAVNSLKAKDIKEISSGNIKYMLPLPKFVLDMVLILFIDPVERAELGLFEFTKE